MTTPTQASNAPVDKATADQIVKEVKGKVAQMGIRLPSIVTYFVHTVSKLTITRKTPTADISYSGEIRINPDFYQRLPIGQRSYLIAHEIMHPFCAHGARRGNRDPGLWNIAGDAVINTILDTTTDRYGEPLFPEADRIPSRITLPAGFTGDMTTERIYDYILRNAPPPPPMPPPPPEPGDDDEDGGSGMPMPSPSAEQDDSDEDGDGDEGEGEGGEGDDEADGDGEGEGEGEPSPGEGEQKPGGKGRGKGDQKSDQPQPKPGEGCGMRDDDEEDDEKERADGQKVGEHTYEIGKGVNLRDITQVDAAQGKAEAIERASDPTSRGGEGHGLAGRAAARDGRNDWRTILRRIVAAEIQSGGTKATYARAARREGLDRSVMRAGHYDDKIHIGVLMDVSGSVSRDWVERAVGECHKLIKQYPSAHIWAAAHTSVVIGPVWLSTSDRKKNEETLAKLAGHSGGTLFAGAYKEADAANPRLDVLIHFTDGGLMEDTWPRLNRAKKLVVIVTGAPVAGVKAAVPPGTEVWECTDGDAKPVYA